MRLIVVAPAVVLLVCTAAIGLVWTVEGQAAAERRRAEAVPRTGMDVLNAYTCGRGETKRIVVRGVEDAYSPAGTEPGFIRPGRTYAGRLPRDGTGEYDQVNPDRGFTDSFNVKGPFTSGVFLIRAHSLNGGDNDAMIIGDMAGDASHIAAAGEAGGLIKTLATSPAWTVDGDLHYAEIDALTLDGGTGFFENEPGASATPASSLKSYLNDPAMSGWLDVFIQDDTVIDFMGLALCSPPAVRRGLTLTPYSLPSPEYRNTVHLVCHMVQNSDQRCEPYVGDTLCSTELPVACILPGDISPPTFADGRTRFSQWSGGRLGVTEPVRGDRFRTVRDVEAFCARRFGAGWRVAALHDGGRDQAIAGAGDPSSLTGGKVWVDIADQPHATCWARQ